jgi:hypothetical protein
VKVAAFDICVGYRAIVEALELMQREVCGCEVAMFDLMRVQASHLPQHHTSAAYCDDVAVYPRQQQRAAESDWQ